jgi:hypothetical protein
MSHDEIRCTHISAEEILYIALTEIKGKIPNESGIRRLGGQRQVFTRRCGNTIG